MRSIDGAVAVITGAGSGIGRATAHALARRGCAVVVSDLDAARAEAVADEIDAAGGQRAGVPCDVASDDDVAALAQRAMSTFGRVDIVMSNVGVIAKGLPLEIPMDAWSSIIDVNLLGTVRVLQAFLPPLLEQGRGHVVTTGSTAGLFPYAFDRLPVRGDEGRRRSRSPSRWRSTCGPGHRRDLLLPRRGDHQHRRADPRVRAADADPGPAGPADHAPKRPASWSCRASSTDELLVLTDPVAAAMVERHATDRDGFLRSQIEYLEGGT